MKAKGRLIGLICVLGLLVGLSVSPILSQGAKDFERLIEQYLGIQIASESTETPEAITCTLDVPSVVKNGELFQASVSYNPSISGSWKETFIFSWPSSFDGFDESTVRVKEFKDNPNPTSGSFENVAVPVASSIEGTFQARVIVKDGDGNRVCSDTAEMTVVNP